MNRLLFKTFYLPLSLILIASCGGGKEDEEFKFYALKEATSQQLELTVEASGTVRLYHLLKLNQKHLGKSFI